MTNNNKKRKRNILSAYITSIIINSNFKVLKENNISLSVISWSIITNFSKLTLTSLTLPVMIYLNVPSLQYTSLAEIHQLLKCSSCNVIPYSATIINNSEPCQ